MRPCLAMALGLVMLLASTARAATGDAETAFGFARLAVDWPAPVALLIEERGEIVQIQASRPFPLGLAARANALEPGLATAELNDTATILELRAAAGGTIETAILDDRSLRIGLLPPAALALGIRLGRHPDFERVVIEPIAEHQMRLRQDGSRLTVTLPGRLAPADRARLAGIAGIERLAATGNQLFFDLAPGTDVRPLFVAPDRQVLDIYTTSSLTRAAGSGPAAEAAGPAANPVAVKPATRGDGWNPPSKTTLAADQVEIHSHSSLPTRVPPWTTPSFSELEIDASRLADDTVELGFTWPEPVPAAVFVRGAQLWVAFAANTGEISLDRERFGSAARRFIGALREEEHPEATLIRLTLTEPTRIDVQRDDSRWRLVLDAATSDPSGQQEVTTTMAGDNAPTSFGLLLPGIDAAVSVTDPVVGDRLGIGMARTSTGSRTAAARFVGLRLLPAAQGAVWQQLAEAARGPSWTTAGLVLGPADGVVGPGSAGPTLPAWAPDSLPIAQDVPPDPAEPEDDRPPDAPATELASTPNEPAPDDLAPGDRALDAPVPDDPAAPRSAEPPAAIGLTASLSPVDEPPIQAEAPPPPGPLDLARYHTRRGRTFWDYRTALVQPSDTADRPDPEALALELARLHVAHGLGPEAASMLTDAATLRPVGDSFRAWQALSGAAQLLAGRHAAALDHLARAELEADDEAALWRGAALAALERWDEALDHWQRGEPWLAGYEPAVQIALAEHGIMLLLQTGRIDEAFALLERLAILRLPAAAGERLRELEAIALQRDGAIDEARTIWQSLVSEGSPEARSRALVNLVFSDLEAGRIEPDLAIDRLVADSVHWRGQSDEIAKRRRLAGLQQTAGRTEAALATLQGAFAGDPPVEAAALITADMSAIVDSLFDELARGERSATATLLLYRRYAELVAAGPAGDAHVQALAAALSELGLDDAAIDLLRSRLQRSETRDAGRAALGSALAALLAQNGDGRGAMAALVDSTPIAAIDEGLAEARRSLFATIGGAGTPSATDSKSPADNLRDQARRAFDRRAWRAVVEATATLVADLPAGKLDAAATEIVLMAATAARQLGDDPTVEQLVAAHGERLATAGDNAVLGLLAEHTRFTGAAGEVLADATSYTRAMRSAIAGMPSL